MSESLISIQGLSSGYGGIPVLRQLSLTVGPGEVVALLGPNGAGKTTTLLTISGILQPIGGRVDVLGEDIAGQKPEKIARRGLAHVAEDRSLFFDLTVKENLRLGLTVTARSAGRPWNRRSRCFRLCDPWSTDGPASCRVANNKCWPWPEAWRLAPRSCSSTR